MKKITKQSIITGILIGSGLGILSIFAGIKLGYPSEKHIFILIIATILVISASYLMIKK